MSALPLHARPRGLGRPFASLWAATAASNLSDGLRLAVLPLLAASLTSNPGLVAGVAVASQAPWLFLGLLSGALVDRLDRRRLLGLAHLARMVVVTGLLLSVATGVGGLAAVYAAALLLGAAETIFDNAAQAVVPQLVPADLLEAANGRQAMAVIGGQDLVGPLVGAALFAAAAPAALAVDALGLALAAGLVFSLPPRAGCAPGRGSDGPPRLPLRAEMSTGVRWLWGHPTLRAVTIAATIINVAVMAHVAVLVLYSLQILGLGEVGYALLLATAAAGGFAGAVAAPRLSAAVRLPRLLPAVVGAAGAAVAVLGVASSPLLAGAAITVVGAAGTVWAVVTASLRQRLTPDGLLGRVIGVHQLCSWGGAALGGVVGGLVATAADLRAPFLSGAAVLALVALALLRVREV